MERVKDAAFQRRQRMVYDEAGRSATFHPVHLVGVPPPGLLPRHRL
jgi:hypothetical protein